VYTQSNNAIPDTKHAFFKARSTGVANIILSSFKAASICIAPLRTQLSQVRPIFGGLVDMHVGGQQTDTAGSSNQAAFVFLHT